MFHVSKKMLASKNRATILPDRHAKIVNYVISLLLIVISLLLLAMFFSYSPLDNTWFYANGGNVLYNKLGSAGAYISDVFFSIFGFSSWWFAITLLYIGLVKFVSPPLIKKHWYAVLQYVALIILVVSSSTLEYIYFYPKISLYLHEGYGGMLGNLIYSKVIIHYKQNITYISTMLFITMCLSLILSIRLFFVYLTQALGVISLALYRLMLKVLHKLTLSRNKDLLMYQDSGSNLAVANPTIKPTVPSTSNEFILDDLTSHDDSIITSKDHAIDEMSLPFDSDLINEQINYIPKQQQATKQHDNQESSAVKLKPRVRTLSLNDLQGEKRLPSIDLLNSPKLQGNSMMQDTIDHVSNTIENKLMEFGVEAKILNAMSGPVVTRYELLPSRGVRGDKIVGLAKEIARGLALNNVRIVETIPGKNFMGIEVPNITRQTIYLKEIFTSRVYHNSNSKLTLALGKDIGGDVIVTDLAKMPHLLVAGTTGSGKSVAVNAMILSILFQATPDEVKFIMIDPKMVELSFYEGIPHLLAPVVTDMSQAANALKWAVAEMERRYKIMAKLGCKNILTYNQKVKEAIDNGNALKGEIDPVTLEATLLEPWAYIVVIIDELADLMMVAGKKIEQYIARIAQKARAIGIHLIVATQRPSVDVITGLIKANIPARISFQVSSKIDSRTILDQMGAEALLGQGDMLYLQPGSGWTQRVHGAYVDDDELNKVVAYLKTVGKPDYIDEILTGEVESFIPGVDDNDNDSSAVEKDAMFDQAVQFINESKRCSISALQTRFGIGYNRAARIMNHLEKLQMVRRNERNAYELLNQNALNNDNH